MFRTDLWVSAFVRRHNDLGTICVVSRRGDPLAGQILVEVDHLNGTASLFTPAPLSLVEAGEDRVFVLRIDKGMPQAVRERIMREEEFDPDFWVVSLDKRDGDVGLEVVG